MSDLAVQKSQMQAVEYVPSVAITLEQAKENMQRLHQVVKDLMEENVDYGKIPGTPKPTLLKPGAEKLLQFYGLGHRATCADKIEDWEKGFFYYRYRVDVFKTRPDGLVIEVASCEGSANSKEKRYRNQDVYTIVNTLQKMAVKRALVGASLQATGTSGIFTQDLEDIGIAPENEVPRAAPRKPKQRQQPQQFNGQPATEAQLKKIYAQVKEYGLEKETMVTILKDMFGKDHSKELTKKEASDLIEFLADDVKVSAYLFDGREITEEDAPLEREPGEDD